MRRGGVASTSAPTSAGPDDDELAHLPEHQRVYVTTDNGGGNDQQPEECEHGASVALDER